jgi:hypothetical protein
MSSKKVEQKILQIEQHLKILDQERSDKNLGDAEREKRGLERMYLLWQEPYAWRNHAHTLKRAADAVLEQYVKEFPWHVITFLDMDSVCVYLTGMAIENLLKGIYVARHPELIKLQKEQVDEREVGYKLHDDLRLHNLTALAKKLKKHNKIEFTADELGLMALFERFITWAGRYRIPLDSITFIDAQFSTYYLPDGAWRPIGQGDVTTFSANFNKLYSKLDGILKNDVEDWSNILSTN